MSKYLLASLLVFGVCRTPEAAGQVKPDFLKGLSTLPALNFKSDPYIRAAAGLQRLGKEKAGELLLQLNENGGSEAFALIV